MWRTVAPLVSILLVGICGCCPSEGTSAIDPPSLAGLDLVHDFGSIVEGRDVEHSFKIANRLKVPLLVADDTDVQKTCGCTTLEPSTKHLLPGETAAIRMRVNTTGKNGRFRVGGLIRWRTDDGESWPVNLYLEGIAKAVLVAEPGLIQFSPIDIAEQKPKEISVFNSQAINWSTLYVHVKPPCADIIETAIYPDHLKLKLRANPSTEETDFSAILRLTADLETAEPGAKTCRPLDTDSGLTAHRHPGFASGCLCQLVARRAKGGGSFSCTWAEARVIFVDQLDLMRRLSRGVGIEGHLDAKAR